MHAYVPRLAALLAVVSSFYMPPLQNAGPADSATGPVQTLELGKPVTRELHGGESHEYQVALSAGQFARVLIYQKTIDMRVDVFSLDNSLILGANAGAIGQFESASLIAPAAGMYRIRASSVDGLAPVGEYEIKLAEVKAATDVDQHRVAGDKALADSMALYVQQKAEAKRAAIQKAEEAVEHWHAAHETNRESWTMAFAGYVYKELGEKQKSLDITNQALQIARDTADVPAQEWALVNLAYAYENFGDVKRGLELFGETQELLKKHLDKDVKLRTLNGIGVSHAALGELKQAIADFQEAVAVCRELHCQFLEATLINNMAVTWGYLGEYQKQIDLLKSIIALRQRFQDRAGEAVGLNNMGTAYSNLGEYQKAMDSYTAAYNIAHELGIPQDQAVDLNNIAWLYSATGDFDSALKFYEQSVELSRKMKDQWRLGVTLTNIGSTYADLHLYDKALEIDREGLEIHRAVGNHRSEGSTLSNMAYAFAKLGDKQKALEYYLKAVDILRKGEDRDLLVQSLRSLGAMYRQVGDRGKAMENLNESLRMTVASHDSRSEAEALGQIAHVELDQGELIQALKDSEAALARFESVRSTLTNPKLRASFSQAGRKTRETHLQILSRLHREHPDGGYDSAALVAAEKTRARSLLELLGESQAKIREGVDPALIQQEVALRQTIANKARLQQTLLAGKHTDQQAEESIREMDGLTHEYDQLESTIREKSPAWTALTAPTPLTLRDIQQRVLDDETLLLEYTLGDDASFLFLVSSKSLDLFELPQRDVIETAGRRAYDLLIARNRHVAGETPQQTLLRVHRAEADYPQAALELSRMILGPAASRLNGKRLLVVADGALQYVPFAALPDPAGMAPGKTQPLIATHEVVTAPSASVLAQIREDASHRKPAEKRVAIIADPVFTRDDPRMVRKESVAVDTSAHELPADMLRNDVTRSAAESGMGEFERLRFSRQEALQIARLVQGPEKLTALDFSANREIATDSTLAQYRMVHFATHGIINNQHPELSGLVLSLVNKDGESVDGFLRLYDVYNLKLNADLVVLSACQTALGKEMTGEGLVGLTRGFVYAGAPRVVASVWQIDDRVTAELMESFYRGMLVRGERPAAALRSAQLAIWKTKGWDAPYYWAAFTLQGEWK
jgi:CHAT domain-containing protein